MSSNTCKDCTKRHFACHDTCQDYKDFKSRFEAVRKAHSTYYETRVLAPKKTRKPRMLIDCNVYAHSK